MHSHFRFTSMREAVEFLMHRLDLTNQQATHFVWDNQFTVGTDRAIWITL